MTMDRFFKSFLLNNSIHGQMHLAKDQLTLIEKCCWLLVLLASIFSSVQISIKAMQRYFNASTVIALEFDYYRNITKPSITVCPYIYLDNELFEAFVENYHIEEQRKYEFRIFLETLANINYNTIHQLPRYDRIDETLAMLHITPKDYITLIYNLTINYAVLLDANREFHADAITATDNYMPIYTRQVLTENGLCYMANSYLDIRYSSTYFINNSLPNVPFENERMFVNFSEADFFEEYATVVIQGMSTNFTVFITSPFEVPDLDHNTFAIRERAQIYIHQIEFRTEKNLERLTTVNQRHCRLPHENNLTHFPFYTRNLCLQQCRIDRVYMLCGCIPHFYPNRVKYPKKVCSYMDLLNCVAKNKDMITKLGDMKHTNVLENGYRRRDCHCEPNCRDSLISISEVVEIFGDVLSNSKSLEATLEPSLPIIYVRRVIYTFSDLLVSIGGTAGLFIGFSVMGAIEVVYFFTLRIFWFLHGNYE